MAASENNNKKDFLEKPLVTMIITSLIHLPVIVHAHASTHATSLMHVKNNMPHFCL